MKNLQIIIWSWMLFSIVSCSNIVFNEAVPKDEKALNEFPKELQGFYIDEEDDTLKITNNKYSYGELNGKSFLEGTLSEELVLKQKDDYYFLNFKSHDRFWEMIAAQKTVDGLILMCLDAENKSEIKNINKYLKKGKAKSLKNDGKYLIDPDSDELINILNDSSNCEKTKLTRMK